jgi:hypothetical protein
LITKAENLMRVLQGEKPEWTPVECPADQRYGEGAYQFVTYKDALPPHSGGYDLWGTRWSEAVDEELPYIVEHPLTSMEQLLRFDFPAIKNDTLWQEASNQVQASEDVLSIGRQVSCLWERLYFLIGFETALMALVEQQDLATEVLGHIAEWQIAAGRKFIKIGVDAVRISDDYGSQKNLLMSPKTWRKVIRPSLTKVVAFYKEKGVPVALHSCGNLQSIMDDLVELEFAAFNIQTNANNLVAYKQRYGRRFRLWGGLSTQSVLAAGSSGEIRQAVRDIIALFGRDGLLILEPDQVVTLPEENLKIYWESAYPCHLR